MQKKLQKDLAQLIQASTMEPQEKAMWMMLIPQMEANHLKRLKEILKKEVESFTDLSLEVVNQK